MVFTYSAKLDVVPSMGVSSSGARRSSLCSEPEAPNGPRRPAASIHCAHVARHATIGMRSTATNGIAMDKSGTSTRREPKMLKARDAAYAHLYTIGDVTWHDDDGPDDRRTTPKSPSPIVSSSSDDTTSLGVRPPRRGSGTPGSCSRSNTTSSTKYATLPARPASPKRRRNHWSGRSHGTFQLSIAVTARAPWKPNMKMSAAETLRQAQTIGQSTTGWHVQGKRAPYPPAELRVRREHEHRALLLALLHEDGRALGRLYGWAGVQVKRCMGALVAMERAPASEEEAPAEDRMD